MNGITVHGVPGAIRPVRIQSKHWHGPPENRNPFYTAGWSVGVTHLAHADVETQYSTVSKNRSPCLSVELDVFLEVDVKSARGMFMACKCRLVLSAKCWIGTLPCGRRCEAFGLSVTVGQRRTTDDQERIGAAKRRFY